MNAQEGEQARSPRGTQGKPRPKAAQKPHKHHHEAQTKRRTPATQSRVEAVRSSQHRAHFRDGSQAAPGAVSRPGLSWLTVAGSIEAARKRRDLEEVESHTEPNKT